MQPGDHLIDKKPVKRQGSFVLRVRVVEAMNATYARLRTVKEYLPDGYNAGWYSPNIGRTNVVRIDTIDRQMKPYIESDYAQMSSS